MIRHLLSVADLTAQEVDRIFAVTTALKKAFKAGMREPLLAGRVMALLFEKPSLRTRVSFEAAMAHLGGSTMFLGSDVGFGKRESLEDFGRMLSEYVDIVVIRAFGHQMVERVAAHCDCPVINGLTDFSHPCQALADLYTLAELAGPLAGRTLAWIGDANNVARSLAIGCGRVGMKLVMATPQPYQFDAAALAWIRQQAPQLELRFTTDPAEAVAAATAVYTDVWASMGQESQSEKRRQAFMPYQVNAKLMAHAPKNAVFMHCLPAHRGDEVTAEVIDGPQSVVVPQAANRMHVQKGIVAWLLGVKQ